MNYEFELDRGDLKVITISEEPGWLRVDVQVGSDEGVMLYSAQARVAVKGGYRVQREENRLIIRIDGSGQLAGRHYEF